MKPSLASPFALVALGFTAALLAVSPAAAGAGPENVVTPGAASGEYRLTQGDQLTVRQALAMAGGLKDFADAKNIKILRKSSKSGQPITFNYKDAIHGSAPVYLHPGDTVVVPD